MRAARIFVKDLKDHGLLDRVKRLKVALYGSLAATGKGHLSPQALIAGVCSHRHAPLNPDCAAGFEGSDCETVDTDSIPSRYETVKDQKFIVLGGQAEDIAAGSGQRADFDIAKDLVWLWDSVLPMHPNGSVFRGTVSFYAAHATRRMLFSVYDEGGDLLATNTYYSVRPLLRRSDRRLRSCVLGWRRYTSAFNLRHQP